MKKLRLLPLIFLLILSAGISAQEFSLTSPDSKISLEFWNSGKPGYLVKFNGNVIVDSSSLGFEFKGEPAMAGGF